MSEIDPEKILAAFEAERRRRDRRERFGPRTGTLVALVLILLFAVLSLWGLMMYLESQLPSRNPSSTLSP